MKSRQTLFILLIVALVVVYYIFGSSYFKERRSNASLNQDIAAATQQLALLPLPPKDIIQRQEAASAELKAELDKFPVEINTTKILNGILKLAQAAGVTAVPVITQEVSPVSVNGTDYPVFRLSLDVKGDYTQVAGFIHELETSQPSTMVIENLSMEPTGDSAANADGADVTPVDVLLNIAIYARPVIKAG
jgi:hypothetical protein